MEALSVGLVLFLAGIGLPLFLVMGILALLLFYFAEVESAAVIIELYRLASAPTILTIPLFTLAGYIISESKAPQRIFKAVESVTSFIPSSVALVSLIVCAFFTAFTGASGITIIALGGIIYPILQKEKYSDDFSVGLITTSGSLGLLFPPSLPLILYGIIGNVDIDKLFLAGIIPGIILILLLYGYSILRRPVQDKTIEKKTYTLTEIKAALWSARYELPLPFIVLTAIYGGFTTVTETATLILVYVFLVEVVILKDVSLKLHFPKIIKESMSLIGSILMILCCALGFTNYLIDEEIPQKIFILVESVVESKWQFLIVLNIFLLIIGALMDIFSAIIVVVPIIIPLAEQYGIDPIHLAIIFLTNLEIGFLTPPVGINLFISSFRFNRSIVDLYKVSFPFLITLIIGLLIITFFEDLSLFLVR
ncbi:TRAP transporter large permease subunit [Bacteriovoracaceae bacterium]|nr:TRAP transporter large permease subunit [Bacteriovoracaceae bacterium]